MKRKYYFMIITAVLVIGLFTGCGNEADELTVRDNSSIEETTRKEMEETADTEAEVPTDEVSIEDYYGFYQITKFLPSRSWSKGSRYDRLTEQEADMLLGRIVELSADRLVTYDSFRWLGSRDGRVAFPGNYIIEEIIIENPQYSWDCPNTDTIPSDYSYVSSSIDVDMIEGKISIQVAASWYEHYYYVMPEGILMYSTLSGEYFYLEKLGEKQERMLSEEEQNEILQKLFGVYTITEFLPTKFYPAADSSGNPYLPEEEADMMIGREVTISEDLFTSYDNFRLPNSGITNRGMDDFFLKEVEILSPDYRIEEKNRKELYGLRDDEMLRKELRQKTYVEVSVFPGYRVNGDDCLPQIYLLNDNRIMMYAMGEFFLLDKADDLAEQETFVGNEYPDVPEVYRNVLWQYEQAIGECADMSTFYKRQEGGEWPDVYNYLMSCAWDKDIYYCLRDVTDDGFPELIMGLDKPDVIYYYNDEEQRVIEAYISGGYYIFNLYEGGAFAQEHGDRNGSIAYYQFRPDTKQWKLIIWSRPDREENLRYYRYIEEGSDVVEEVPEEEARQIIDQLTGYRIELEWTLLDVS